MRLATMQPHVCSKRSRPLVTRLPKKVEPSGSVARALVCYGVRTHALLVLAAGQGNVLNVRHAHYWLTTVPTHFR